MLEILCLQERPKHAIQVTEACFDEWPLSARLDFGANSPDELLATMPLDSVFVTVLDGEFVGTATLHPCDMPKHLPYLGPWLSSLYVAPGHRRKGIGSALARHVCGVASQRGHDTIYLWTEDTGFYKRLGWVTMKQIDYYGTLVSVMQLST